MRLIGRKKSFSSIFSTRPDKQLTEVLTSFTLFH